MFVLVCLFVFVCLFVCVVICVCVVVFIFVCVVVFVVLFVWFLGFCDCLLGFCSFGSCVFVIVCWSFVCLLVFL